MGIGVLQPTHLLLILIISLVVFVFVVPFALLLIALRRGQRAAPAPSGAMQPCPYCAEPIRAAATVCRYCGRDLPPTPIAARPG